jgi:hypothetical protein
MSPGGLPGVMLGAKQISYVHAWTLCSLERKPSDLTIRV